MSGHSCAVRGCVAAFVLFIAVGCATDTSQTEVWIHGPPAADESIAAAEPSQAAAEPSQAAAERTDPEPAEVPASSLPDQAQEPRVKALPDDVHAMGKFKLLITSNDCPWVEPAGSTIYRSGSLSLVDGWLTISLKNMPEIEGELELKVSPQRDVQVAEYAADVDGHMQFVGKSGDLMDCDVDGSALTNGTTFRGTWRETVTDPDGNACVSEEKWEFQAQ